MDIMTLLIRLFNVSISASFLAVAIMLVRLIFKKAPKGITVLLWGLVAIRLICPLSLESTLSLIPSNETIPEQILTIDPSAQQDASFGLVENPAYSDYINSTVVVDNVFSFQRDMKFISVCWLIGMALLLLYALISYLRLRYKVRTAMPLKGNVWLCDNVKSPFILGVFRPRIYLPSDMDEQTAELVLRHERAHLKRKDHLWKPFGFVLLSFYWFNPVLWLSYILLCRDIELACDEKVIKDMENADKKAYSEALLSCSIPHRMIAACPVAFGEVGVKKRIKSVLNYKKPAFWVILIAVIASIAVAVCFMTDPKGQNGGTVTFDGIDEISELSFDMEKITSSAYAYTVYDGNSTTDNYFEAIEEYFFCFSDIYSFLYELDLSTIVDGAVNPMHEPQTNGVIKISYDGDWSVSVIFHDNFSKMYMQKNKTDGTSIRSKDYTVDDPVEAKKFFKEKPYIDDFRIWEFNPASSAWGDGQIIFWLDSKYKINGKIKGEGKIAKITNEDTGEEGISWSPEITDNPGEYEFEIPVIRDGEERVFTFGMKMLGKSGLSSYYIIRQGNMRINTYNDRYEYEMIPTYSVDSTSWMYNPRTSDHMTCVLPSGYKIKSVVATSGTTRSYESLFFDRGGTVSWTPDKISEDAVLVINTEKDGRSVKFILDIKFLEYFPSGERMSYTISPVNCWIHDEVSGSGIFNLEEKSQQDDGIIWSYNPSAGATWWYQTKYILPEGYEIKSAEATSGEATVEDLYYDNPDNVKCVCWTPGEDIKETELVITALNDEKKVKFKVNIMPILGNFDSFKITPVNCKMTEESTATYLLEEN